MGERLFSLACLMFASVMIYGQVRLHSKRLVNDYRSSFNQLEETNENFINNGSGLITTASRDSALKTNTSGLPLCKKSSVEEFPADFIPFDKTNYARLFFHILIIVYLLAAITIVCDDFFVEALNKIATNLQIKENVAGATFMAAGSSAPELFTSLIGVVVAKSDIGIGTIVGSALFNILFIISICAIVNKSLVSVDYYPVTRDCTFYVISIIGLIIVLLDGRVYWYESIVLLVLYAVYILFMFYNDDVEKVAKDRIEKVFRIRQHRPHDIENNGVSCQMTGIDGPMIGISTVSLATMATMDESTTGGGGGDSEAQINLRQAINDEHNGDPKKEDAEEEEDEPFYPFRTPKRALFFIPWLCLLPIKSVFYFTIPDCKRKSFDKFPFYLCTFLVSCCYMGVFTYGVVWMIVIIADKLNIPDTVAGLTILAAGASVPEIITSVLIARQGKAAMAISNSIGSNVFDILVCLGVPWFVESSVVNKFSFVQVYSGSIIYSTIILLSSVVILFGLLLLNKWYLTKKLGVILLFIWAIFTALTAIAEYDVFGDFDECILSSSLLSI